jgi:hypothetical protein
MVERGSKSRAEHEPPLFAPLRRLGPLLGVSYPTVYRLGRAALDAVDVPGHRRVLVPIGRVRDVLGSDVADELSQHAGPLTPDASPEAIERRTRALFVLARARRSRLDTGETTGALVCAAGRKP